MRSLERALEICRTLEVNALLPQILSNLGLAYAMVGRHAEALPLVIEGTEKASRGWNQSLHLAILGEVHLRAARVAEAVEVGERALRRARERGEEGSQAWSLRLLGEVDLQRDPSAAAAFFQESLVLSERLDLRPLAAHCHLGLGRLYRRSGDGPKAHEYLTTAATMYREMDMGFYLAQAENVLNHPSD